MCISYDVSIFITPLVIAPLPLTDYWSAIRIGNDFFIVIIILFTFRSSDHLVLIERVHSKRQYLVFSFLGRILPLNFSISGEVIWD